MALFVITPFQLIPGCLPKRSPQQKKVSCLVVRNPQSTLINGTYQALSWKTLLSWWGWAAIKSIPLFHSWDTSRYPPTSLGYWKFWKLFQLTIQMIDDSNPDNHHSQSSSMIGIADYCTILRLKVYPPILNPHETHFWWVSLHNFAMAPSLVPGLRSWERRPRWPWRHGDGESNVVENLKAIVISDD